MDALCSRSLRRGSGSVAGSVSSGCGAGSSDVEYVEIDPKRRYIRYKDVLGRGAFKTVYKAFDEIDGIEIAWNQVYIDDMLRSPENVERLYSEINLLKSLKHKNIMKFYNSWVDNQRKTVNIITELFTSGNLRQYSQKHKSVDLKAIKSWAKQILCGLDYLHSQNPRIIHRDLKCDNIFVNGNHGEVKIGDFGLATVLLQPTARSVIGTPEFMAPELYDEDYNELVDIYSFGMCMLEMVTFEYPYSECKNSAQIFKKVTSGIKPAALGKVLDPQIRQFIEKCLVPASERLSAKELLRDPFFQYDPLDQSIQVSLPLTSQLSKSITSPLQSAAADIGADPSIQVSLPLTSQLSKSIKPTLQSVSVEMRADSHSHDISSTANKNNDISDVSVLEFVRTNKNTEFKLKAELVNDGLVEFDLRIADCSCDGSTVNFPFYLGTDTAHAISLDMVEQLSLPNYHVDFIADFIDFVIMKFVSSWKSYTDHSSNEIMSTESTHKESEISEKSVILDQCLPLVSAVSSTHKGDGVQLSHVEGSSYSKTDHNLCDEGYSSAFSHMNHGDKCSDGSIMSLHVTESYKSFSGHATDFDSKILFGDLDRCNEDLKAELEAIELQYEDWFRELSRRRKDTIESATKRWLMKKRES
ncbi:putative serine/threonine-protein kinase WNK4 [Apostasia shenzhenica]|uniref:non-specific serine/threonine protein kinase n=1 Tax=Apostasia shenzhenica TaxID=1088818 RepID=A0A2H9ZTA6_9ASPA|nr:putative serine/threonine-protein kinase WNK4 [Apostasia shenzhenica]